MAESKENQTTETETAVSTDPSLTSKQTAYDTGEEQAIILIKAFVRS